MITKPIPKAAMPVVEIIRRDVPRPVKLPAPLTMNNTVGLSFDDGCPLGLHRDSENKWPTTGSEFAGGICSTDAVEEFYCWWESQHDPQAAVDAVWPK